MNVTTKRIGKMVGWIALGITVALFAMIAFQIDDWGRDWTQNSASLASDAENQEMRPVELNQNLDQTVKQLSDWVDSKPTWDIVSIEPTEDGQGKVAQMTRTTPILRFVDDIKVTITDADSTEGVVVHAHSQSRVGKGDLGQNPRNLIELTNGLRSESIGQETSQTQ